MRDLISIFKQLNKMYFADTIQASIHWGKQRTPSVWGVYFDDKKEIVINPLLNQDWVPVDFLRYIVYHEMLHQAVPSIIRPNYIRHHSNEFRRRELLFADVEELEAWERKNLHRFRRIKSDFKTHCRKFGLTADLLGKTVILEGAVHVIAGMHPWSPYPIVTRNSKGQLTQHKARTIRFSLSKTNNRSPSQVIVNQPIMVKRKSR